MSNTEKTIQDVLREAWTAKFSILIFACVGLLIGGLSIWSITPQYKATMIVSPANPMNGAEISSLLADDDLFALRYLVQRVGVSNSSDFLRFENIYAGPSVAKILLEDPKIREGLNKAVGETMAWNPDSAAEYLARHVDLEPVSGSTLRRLVYWHPDRVFGVYLLAQLHQASDALIRRNIRDEAQERITYLQNAVATTMNPEHRRALTTLLLEQERLRMLVSIEQPYAAAVVEPAAASTKPLWPDMPMLLSVFALAGALLGFVWHGFRSAPAQQVPASKSAKRWYKDEEHNTNRRILKSDVA